MEAMVAQTLDYVREGRDGEPAVPTDLAAILQTLASDASDAGHDVAYEGPARAVLPLRRLAAKRAFANLVDNAARHGAGPVRLSIAESGRGEVLARVADAGPGIAEGDRAWALDPFVRLDASRCTAGAGLGLAIARRFAEAGGWSWGDRRWAGCWRASRCPGRAERWRDKTGAAKVAVARPGRVRPLSQPPRIRYDGMRRRESRRRPRRRRAGDDGADRTVSGGRRHWSATRRR